MLKNTILITDIGSTTTKALLLKKEAGSYTLVAYETASTTVESPFEDVKIGIHDVAKKIETQHNLQLLKKTEQDNNISFCDDVEYLTTSSAGGGLQILVLGLTLVDSAKSAQRASYGVGGVLLDTIAIDDKRTTLQKLDIINKAHPDIILFSGGTDHGAVYGLYRLAEILKIAKPSSKFTNSKIPLVYAGNKAAIDFVQTLSSDKYDLHIVDNLRPSLKVENLEPTKNKMHDLFMNSVMEQAPGYGDLKKTVSTDIYPTPAGVLNTMQIVGKQHKLVLAFDIGGATTDIFSNVYGKHYRSVNANSGMSYSIGNVLKDIDYEQEVKPYLKELISDENSFYEYFQNYIGNKILYPTSHPASDLDVFIEHLIAISCVKKSIAQHFAMHFTELAKSAQDYINQFVFSSNNKETVYRPYLNKETTFKMSDLEVFIGSGGVISHATKEQAVFILAEALASNGIVELWRDKLFISPHMGILSDLEPSIAEELIKEQCFEKLAISIRFNNKKSRKAKALFTLIVDGVEHIIVENTYQYFVFDKKTKISIVSHQKKILSDREINVEANLPLLIDTRFDDDIVQNKALINKLSPYKIDQKIIADYDFGLQDIVFDKLQKEHILEYLLSSNGEILVNEGEKVEPNTLLARYKYDPALIYVIVISKFVDRTLSKEEVRDGLLVKEGDMIAVGDKIFSLKGSSKLIGSKDEVVSQLRCYIESINYDTGTIIGREIQDYAVEPVEIDICKILNVKPKSIAGYMTRRVGDFVRYGDLLAQNTVAKRVNSQHSGFIKEINKKTGTITIHYDKKPHEIFAQCYGFVDKIVDNEEILIKINAVQIEGRIGFGSDISGEMTVLNNLDNVDIDSFPANRIVFKNHLDDEDLDIFMQMGINGLVCNTMPYPCLKRFLKKDIGVALTGGENIPFSLIVLNGFSSVGITDDGGFMRYDGDFVYMRPYTQIRAGVSRPVIFTTNDMFASQK